MNTVANRLRAIPRWQILLVLSVILLGMIGLYGLRRDWSASYGNFPKEGIIIEIPRGSSHRQIAELLAAKGVVRSALSFRLLAARNYRRTLHAGEYFFDQRQPPTLVMRMLILGRVYLHPVTIPEGYTTMDIADLLEKAGLAMRKDFLETAADPTLVRYLAPGARSLEGFLFPDTYKFPKNTPPRRIAEAMVKRFREAWSKLPQDHSYARLSPLGLVTMASLIERETAVAEERPRVASVFYNRLEAQVALACDPTVIYALRLQDRYSGTLTSADMHFDSPYNTYLHRGLPPGPIANPGAASLLAAVEPERTNFLYFVADAQGRHVFSRTLLEHNRNVMRYRQKLAEINREQAREVDAPLLPDHQAP